MNNEVLDNKPFVEYKGEIGRIGVRGKNDVVGEIIDVDNEFLTVLHRNNHKTKIRIKDICYITSIEVV